MSEQKNFGQKALTETFRAVLKSPSLYKVVLLNDDYTPMDFVVRVLKSFFAMPEEKAQGIMLQIHYTGSAICAIYPKEIAETKVAQVNEFARRHEYPLLCRMEVA